MNKDNPTFEELIGEEDLDSFNELQEGELSTVSTLANKQLLLAQELATLEEAVKAKKEELRLTSEQELPEAMQTAGLTEIVLSTGDTKA